MNSEMLGNLMEAAKIEAESRSPEEVKELTEYGRERADSVREIMTVLIQRVVNEISERESAISMLAFFDSYFGGIVDMAPDDNQKKFAEKMFRNMFDMM